MKIGYAASFFTLVTLFINWSLCIGQNPVPDEGLIDSWLFDGLQDGVLKSAKNIAEHEGSISGVNPNFSWVRDRHNRENSALFLNNYDIMNTYIKDVSPNDHFDGVARVSIPNFTLNSHTNSTYAYSISIWIKPSHPISGDHPQDLYQYIIHLGRPDLYIHEATSKLIFPYQFQRPGSPNTTNLNLSETGQANVSYVPNNPNAAGSQWLNGELDWYHIVLTYEITPGQVDLKVYLGGELHSSETLIYAGEALTFNHSSTTKFTIGSDQYGKRPFSGAIDDLRIYDKALDTDDVRDLYNEEPSNNPVTVDNSSFWQGTSIQDDLISRHGPVLIGENVLRDHLSSNTSYQQYKLIVEGGGILTEKVKLAIYDESKSPDQQISWPDYVFDANYSLLDLDTLSQYIRDNKHLPGIPSALEVENDGIDLGEMQAALLEKVEELTLYILELNYENQKLKARLEEFENNLKRENDSIKE